MDRLVDGRRPAPLRCVVVGGGGIGVARRASTIAAAVLLATAGLTVNPRHAAAARSLPWRFYNVTQPSAVAANDGETLIVLQCPAGYTATSGGIAQGDDGFADIQIMQEYPDLYDGTFHIKVRETGSVGSNMTVGAVCVDLADVGTIDLQTADFVRNGSGRAGGTLSCPDGETVLSGGADWSNTSDLRQIDFSSPVTTDGTTGSGWYVAGYSDQAGTLHLDLRCVSASLVTGEYATVFDTHPGTSGDHFLSAGNTCNPGYRLLAGGAAPEADQRNPGVDQGYLALSGPTSYRLWNAYGLLRSGLTFWSFSLCVPASTVSVGFSQVPPSPSNAATGTISFTATDSVGEMVDAKCTLDNNAYQSCVSGGSELYGPLLDGPHHFHVDVSNQSGGSASNDYYWTVDTQAPTVESHAPTSGVGLTNPITITFSEPVQAVTAATVTVHAQAENIDVAGTVTRPTTATATWTPKSPLVPGETYQVTLHSAIHDIAGNHLTATLFAVRATTTVENTSPALAEFWDLDNDAVASGGSYSTSRVSGSRADLTFTATQGQTVALYAVRLPTGGYADVYLDGAKVATPSFYAAAAAHVRVYLSGALTAGTHTLSVRPLGTKPASSTGAWVSIDDAVIGGTTTKQESAFTQQFRRVTSSSAFGGSYDLVVHTTDSDNSPRYQATVVGTGFKVYATKTATSGSTRIYVDGVLQATVSLHAASTTYKALVYTGSFSLGVHVIKVVAVGTSSGSTSDVDLDRLSVT